MRERLLTFADSISPGVPTNEQLREGRALMNAADAALERYHQFVTTEITPLQRELERAGAPLNLAERPGPDPKPGPDVDERAERRRE